MTRRRIALFADGGFLAHTTRVLEVGKALRAEFDHEVFFCCQGPYARLLTQAGFPVLPVYSVDREETLRLARRAGACDLRWWRQVANDSVASDLEAIDALSPDLVVGDLRMSLTTSARARGIPLVSLTNAAWTSRFAEPISVPDGHVLEESARETTVSRDFSARETAARLVLGARFRLGAGSVGPAEAFDDV